MNMLADSHERVLYLPLLREKAAELPAGLSVMSTQPECRRRRSATTSLGLDSSAMVPDLQWAIARFTDGSSAKKILRGEKYLERWS